MSTNKKIIIVVLLASLVLSACGAQAGTDVPTLDVDAIMTAGVGTFIANMHETQTAQATLATNTATNTPTQTNTPISLVTATPPATWTLAPINNIVLPTVYKSPVATGTQFTPTVDPALSAVGCNNLGLIYDVNIPAGSVIKPGESFTKTWKVENNGTCDWVLLYRLVFISGDRMEGDPSALGKVIVPGKWTQLSVTLTAPLKGGTYTGTWRLGTQAGNAFGSTLTVSIVVGNPTNTPEPTSTPTNTPVPTSYP